MDFFKFPLFFGSEKIEEVCHAEAFQKLMPYGSTPQIIKTQTPYEVVLHNLPSADQPTEMKGQAAYIANYPIPITIDGMSYNYFIYGRIRTILKKSPQQILFLP